MLFNSWFDDCFQTTLRCQVSSIHCKVLQPENNLAVGLRFSLMKYMERVKLHKNLAAKGT